MSLDDWRFDDGWRGILYVSAQLVWTVVRLLVSLAIMGLVLWFTVAWVAETFFTGGAG